MKKGSWLAGRALPGKCFRVTVYTKVGLARNSRQAIHTHQHREPELTKGGRVIKCRRPQWSASLCNTVATLAGIGQEVRRVG